jgi:hypothetical protein
MLAEFHEDYDCESEYSGKYFHSTEEVAFDNQEQFNKPLKLVIMLLDTGLKTHINIVR